MPKLREMVMDNIASSEAVNNERKKTQDKAMLFISIAIYFLAAGT